MTNREHYDIDLVSMSSTIAFASWLKRHYLSHHGYKGTGKLLNYWYGFTEYGISITSPDIVIPERGTTEELFEIWIKLEYHEPERT